jgi:hypothetical protein
MFVSDEETAFELIFRWRYDEVIYIINLYLYRHMNNYKY